MATEFTKGPWEMEPEETTDSGDYTAPQVFSVADPDNPKIVCTLAVRNGMTEIANARLIAAAPELLEALMALRTFMWAEGYADQNMPMAKADAVIRKATHE